jgi:small-conductance mechanosensitive channel
MEEARRPKASFEISLIAVSLVLYALLDLYGIGIPIVSQYLAPAALYLTIGVGVILVIVLLIELYGRFTKNPDTTYELVSLVRLLGYPAVGAGVLSALGVNVTSLLVGAGFLGIVVGLAAQTTLGNLFSGFALLYTRPFKTGDKISVSTPQYSAQSPSHPHGMLEVEVTGFVKSIGMMHTRIMRDDMTMIYIPNSIMNLGLITNYSRAPERLVVVRADISRRVDTAALKKRLEKEFHKEEFSSIKDLGLNTATITTDTDVGIIVTARVSQLDYHKMREAMADRLNEVLRKTKK